MSIKAGSKHGRAIGRMLACIILGCLVGLWGTSALLHKGSVRYRTGKFDPLDILAIRHAHQGQGPEQSPQQSIVRGAYADSLRALVPGATFKVGPLGTAHAGREAFLKAGEYDTWLDLVTIMPERTAGILGERALIAHEAGHAFVMRKGAELMPLWPTRLPRADTYASTNRGEAMAEAFSLAVLWLAEAQRDTTGLGATMVALDAVVPGTRLMARVLLSEPMYSGSPYGNSAKMEPIPLWHRGRVTSLERELNWVAVDSGARAEGVGQIVRGAHRIEERLTK